MESTGEPMKIHVTEATYQQTKSHFHYSEGVEVEVKGKGKMKTYFLGKNRESGLLRTCLKINSERT